MINQNDIDLLMRMAKLVNSKTTESLQTFVSADKRVGCIVKYLKDHKIIAIWFDTEKLAERDLRFFFKHHKQSDKVFFINYIDDFYRIGFKTQAKIA